MEDGENLALEAALESAIGDAKAAPLPKPALAPPPQVLVEEDQPEPLEAIELIDDESNEEPAPVVEPEILIEINGRQEVVKGEAKIKELVQKGLDYSRGSEEVARVREQLIAQAQATEQYAQFQQAAFVDISQLQQIDARLQQFNQIDWNALIESDFVGAMKLQAQRQQLNDARQVALYTLNQKKQAFDQSQAQATQNRLATEEAALVAKLPAWRNSEKGNAESAEIRRWAASYAPYGLSAAEVSVIPDHRYMLILRDAYLYRMGKQNVKDKQIREAPPVVKPGAASAQSALNTRTTQAKQLQSFRALGRKGQNRAQEPILEGMLNRAFK